MQHADSAHSYVHSPGFANRANVPGAPELNADRSLLKDLENQMSALRQGAGEDVDILLDMNFNFKTEGYLRVIRALKEFDLFWYELVVFNPEALAYMRQQSNETIASCESLYGHRDFRRYSKRRWTSLSSICRRMEPGSHTRLPQWQTPMK